MSAPASELFTLLDAYRWHPARARVDELVTDDCVREHATDLAATIEGLGIRGLLAARADAANQVAAEGIAYGPEHRPWPVDPLPLPLAGADWSALEAGLEQRARLLDGVLTDLYADRTLLHRRVIPAAAVLAHPGFARAADGSLAQTRRKLVLTATDLGRDATGAWRVISDRIQTPAGAGYAMATRRIVSKVLAGLHRGSDLARLRGFFHDLTGALLAAAPGGTEIPRLVLLSPGATSPSAFDPGFLATLLGVPLAEADDLVMSDGRVWLRAGDDLEPVDVILRRVDDELSDPLEFRGNSEVGLPGLIEASRHGRVSVANPVGVNVLDNPALLAYLPAAAEALLGEEPLLESPRTWWCGDPVQASHVVANLDRLVIKPIARGERPGVAYGWQLGTKQRDDLVARISAEPWQWCGQEPLDLSTAPVVTPSGLEPRRFVLRSFGVAAGDTYRFLPGGLGRVASSTSEHTVSSASGTLAKDVWVPASVAERSLAESARPRLQVARASAVPPRVARTLMAIGRLAERAEGTARLLKVADDLNEDFGSHLGSAGESAASALNRTVTDITGVGRRHGESGLRYLTRVALASDEPGGVHNSVLHLIAEAQEVRDLMSVDIWSVFNRLQRTLEAAPGSGATLQQVLADVLESLLAYAGIMAQSMVRDSSWAFLDAGGRLERAAHTVTLLRATMLDADRNVVADELVAEAVLRAGESIITHRRRAAAGTGPASGAESVRHLLVHDHSNPRSVASQLDQLAADLRLAGDERLAAQAEAIGVEIDAFAGADTERQAERLDALAFALSALRERIAARHFVRQATRRTAETTWAVMS